MLPSPTTPSRSLVLPLWVPGHVQQKTQERHQPYLGPVFSASCQKRGHRWLCPREGDLSCAPFSRQTQGDVPCVWPASPGPAAQSFCHKSTAPPVLRPAATSQKANFTSTLSPVLCSLPDISPPLHLPKAILSEGSERCRLHFSSPLKKSVCIDSSVLSCWSTFGWMEGVCGAL